MRSRSSVWRRVAYLMVLLVGATACGSGAGAPDEPPAGDGDLIARGRDIASSAGCVACHGSAGEGTVGPAWQGLLGSTVTLADGTTVTADEVYIRRSIVTPDAEIVAGFTIEMPHVDLAPDEVDALVAYIASL